MKYLALILCFAAVAYSQDTRRYVVPDVAYNKIAACSTFGFYVSDALNNGTQFIDRKFFMRRRTRMECAPGTLFSLNPNLCICDTRAADLPYLTNPERCVTITGSLQGDEDFQIRQRGDVNQYRVFMGGYYQYIDSVDQCFASNVNNFRFLDFNKNTSVARTSMSISIGFSIPTTGQQLGRQYTISDNGACSTDTRQASFSATYITSNNIGTLDHSLSIDLRLTDRFNTGVGETISRLTCNIPQFVAPLIQGQSNYVWDSSDISNQLVISMDFQSSAGMSVTLTNQDMRGRGIPAGGFCQSQNPTLPTGRGRNRYQVAPRNCPLAFGKAPEDSYMCMYAISFERDCV